MVGNFAFFFIIPQKYDNEKIFLRVREKIANFHDLDIFICHNNRTDLFQRGNTAKRWFKYIKPYLPFFIIGPLCMIVEVIGEVVMPKLLAGVINNANDGVLTVPSALGAMGLMILTALLMMAGGVGGAYFGSKASVSFAADLRADVYARVQKFSFANIDKFSTGSLVTRLTNDVTQLQNFVNMLLRMALRAPGMMISGLIMAIIMNPPLSVVLAVCIPLMLTFIGIIIKTSFPRFNAKQKSSTPSTPPYRKTSPTYA